MWLQFHIPEPPNPSPASLTEENRMVSGGPKTLLSLQAVRESCLLVLGGMGHGIGGMCMVHDIVLCFSYCQSVILTS